MSTRIDAERRTNDVLALRPTFVSFDDEVVASDGEPGDGLAGINIDQLMGGVEQVALVPELDQAGDVDGQDSFVMAMLGQDAYRQARRASVNGAGDRAFRMLVSRQAPSRTLTDFVRLLKQILVVGLLG